MTPGDWAAVIVAIAALFVATLAVPAQAPRRKAVFVVSGVLVAIALGIGAVTLVLSVKGGGGTSVTSGTGVTSQSGTTTSSRPVQSKGSTDRLPGSPKVRIDKTDYLDLPTDEVLQKLSGYGLEVEARDERGHAPSDTERCLVSDLEPAGEVPIGSRVMVTCVRT